MLTLQGYCNQSDYSKYLPWLMSGVDEDDIVAGLVSDSSNSISVIIILFIIHGCGRK